jgi:uncharacterized membrane protein YczE
LLTAAAPDRRYVPPTVRGNAAVRGIVLVLGLLVFAAGIVSIYESRLGLAPWDVLNQGVAEHTVLTFGTANIVIASLILVITTRLDVPIRIGTVANALLVGTFTDLLLRIGSVDRLHENGLGFRIGLLVAGILMMAIGTAFYIGAGFGAGPRDSLMLGVKQRVPFRIGAVRTGIEASALVAGFALGGTVGIGTLAFVLGIGPAVEASFALLRRSPLSSD